MDDIYGFLLLSLLLLLCIHLFNKTTKKRLPPGPTGLPILGNLLTIGQSPHESLAKLAKTYGPLMTVKLGMVNVVIASSADMAKEILQKNDQAFIGRPTPEAVAAEKHYNMSMVWSSGLSPHWKKIRRISKNHLFTTQRLDDLQELRHVMMRKMIARVDEAREAREPLDLGKLAFGTTLNSISNTLFSFDMLDMKSVDLIGDLKEVVSEMMDLAFKPNVADFFPFLRPFDPQGIKRGITVLYDRVHKLLGDIMEQRIRGRACVSDRCGDFMDVLLDHSEAQELNHQNINILIMVSFPLIY
ncbi:geraniol 8-hydroxylase [Phtheirospermum japonicum]|uniref:Geraniol 8-hydroxylase n=1 Tax=Phtheirospermum japonicum TaxID=374723 RepID=A0A830BWI2_9LAMI|nr:geraniol 8-hydroxylase [Phtheirospermum japonicum]